ncbi:MAG: uracil-DNA glycosylase family protein [Nitrospinota bacterium]
MKDSSTVSELFSRYLHFLKQTGISDIALSEKSVQILRKPTFGFSRKNPKKVQKRDPETQERGSDFQSVRLVFSSGSGVSGLLCLCNAVPDEAGQKSADKKLNEIIEKGLKLKAEDVSILTIEESGVEPAQSEEHLEILKNKITESSPRVILAMGMAAASYLFKRTVEIASERGVWGMFEGIRVMPTFHPDYIVRNYTKEVRATVFEDIKKVTRELTKP